MIQLKTAFWLPITGIGNWMEFQESLRTMASADAEQFSAFFRKARRAFPLEVAQGCLIYLGQRELDNVGRKMAFWLAAEVSYCKALLDPNALSDEAALRASAVLVRADSQFFGKFLKEVENLTQPAQILRALSIVPAKEDPTLLPWLNKLTHHGDDRIRSKAMELLSGVRPNHDHIERRLFDDNARVRANQIEALWNLKSSEATDIFRAALADSNNRVVANALVGLHRQGRPEALAKMIELSQSADVSTRRSMAWCLGMTQDKGGIAALQTLAKDPAQVVRTRALQSLLVFDETAAEMAVA